MWKKAKSLVEPLERLMTTLGTRGPKSNTTHSGGHSQITCFTKQQVTEIQKQLASNNFANFNKALEKTGLRNFLFENFSIFKAFSPQPAPIPIVFSKTPLRVCKPQGFGIFSQHAFLHPAGTRNVIGHGSRNFSTIQPTMSNSSGGVLAQLSFKPFSTFANKSGSLWFKREEVLDNNKFYKKQRAEVKKEMDRKFFVQGKNKGIVEIVKNPDVIEDKNSPRVIRRSSIKKSSEKNDVAENIPEASNNSENVVYMSIILSSSVHWNLDDSATSISNSISSINSTNSTQSILSYLLQHRNNAGHNSQLNSSFVQHLREIAEIQHDHMMEVTSILGALLRHDDFEVIVCGCELRINFPRGMRKIGVENMLRNLGIDPNSPHFELEEVVPSLEFSPPTDENDEGMQLPEPNDSYFDEFTSSPDYEMLSCLPSSDSSPVLLPSRGSTDCISSFSSPYNSPPYNSPPRLGAEYITGIQEFLNAVDEALIRDANMFTNREDYDIGEDYYEA